MNYGIRTRNWEVADIRRLAIRSRRKQSSGIWGKNWLKSGIERMWAGVSNKENSTVGEAWWMWKQKNSGENMGQENEDDMQMKCLKIAGKKLLHLNYFVILPEESDWEGWSKWKESHFFLSFFHFTYFWEMVQQIGGCFLCELACCGPSLAFAMEWHWLISSFLFGHVMLYPF